MDACEIWQSRAVLGPGQWRAEADFANFTFVPALPFGEPTFVGTVTDTFTDRRGDVMYAMNVSVSNFDSPVASGIMYVNGGSGRFQNASGKLYLRIDNGKGRGRVNGRLCGVHGLSVLD